jgi:putative holliday junction resolvase
MRVLGLDHGTVRIGVALSDELGIIAQPLEYVPAEPLESALGRIRQLVVDQQVGLIVVGMPRNMDGSYGPAAQKVGEFMKVLAGLGLVPVKAVDERLTSVQANRLMVAAGVRREKRRQKVDQMAAAILLQSYLDSAPSA